MGVVKPEASMSCVRSVSYQIDSISLMASGKWDVGGCGRRHQVMRQKAIFIYQEQSKQQQEEEEGETVTAPLTDWRRRRLWNTNTTAEGQQADASPSQDGAPFGRMQIRPQNGDRRRRRQAGS